VPGKSDRDGFYRLDSSIQAPHKREGGPPYPDEARAAGVSGTVQVEIFIDETGNVVDTRVRESIPLLDAAAIETVRRWHYEPTLVNGRPVRIKMTVPVTFNLPRQ
jgi:TonB family protein